YIILKPSLCGGFESADRWIKLATDRKIGWWATSALESNVGLTAIALWLRKYNVTMPQGLGTGALYTNNVDSPLTLSGENLIFDPSKPLPELPA
ncbi:MAG: o-succinylbenzoate synthase, partial [Muribaculaceae bacterium]|nr:o-succinylbenzoate synthase [Muribaculaceae bacterium]